MITVSLGKHFIADAVKDRCVRRHSSGCPAAILPDCKINMSSKIEEARERIKELKEEIESASQSNIAPQQFFSGMLQRLVTAMGAAGGVVWLKDHTNRLQIVVEMGLGDIGFYDTPGALETNHDLLTDVLNNGHTCVKSPEDGEKLPTEHVLILGALLNQKQCVGVVQVFQRTNTSREARAGFLQFVEQMCGYASKYLERRTGPANSPENRIQGGNMEISTGGQLRGGKSDWDELVPILLQLQRSLNIREVSGTAANDGRRLIGCDRLSVALRLGRRTLIEAVSGQGVVNQRSNLIRRMTELAHKVIENGEPLVSTGSFDDLPAQLADPLTNYLEESGSRLIIILPLYDNPPLVGDENQYADRSTEVEKPEKIIGALIVEQISESEPRPGVLERTQLLSEHIAAALSNAQAHHEIFLLPLWQALGRATNLFRGRKLLKTLAVLAAIIAIGAALAWVPWDYRVEGEGRLMPVIQQKVFAPWDGEVVELYVKGGARVEKGTPLLRLRNDDLRAELLATRNQLNEKYQLLNALQSELDEANRVAYQENQRIQLQGRLVQTQIEIKGLTEQLNVLVERDDALTVRAPIDGVVATFQIEQLLKNRPVHRGETLLDVMDETGDWHLELEVEERRMNHLREAMETLGTDQLPLEFVLATNVEQTHKGKVELIATRANSSQEQQTSIVELIAEIDSDNLPSRRIGAEVTAKINCGKKNLGYVLFGDVVEFFQRYFWL